MVGVRGRRVGVLGLPQPKDLLRICSKSQSCIVPAPGETGRRCPGIVLINTASLSVPRQLLLWGERVLGGTGSVVHGLSGESWGMGTCRSLYWEERDPLEHLPMSRASAARGGSVDLQPGEAETEQGRCAQYSWWQ